jgi:hypothetical protein
LAIGGELEAETTGFDAPSFGRTTAAEFYQPRGGTQTRKI